MSALPPPSYEESQRQDVVAAGKDQCIAIIWFLLSSLIYRISRDYGTFQSWTYTNDAKFWQSPSHHNLPSLPRPRNSFMLNQVSIYLNTMCVQVTTSVSVETPKNAFLLAGVLCFVGLWCGCCLIPLCSDAFKVILS